METAPFSIYSCDKNDEEISLLNKQESPDTKCKLYRLLEEGLRDIHTGNGRAAADVFTDIEIKFKINEI